MELSVILHGLKLVWDKRFRQLVLESDALEAINMIIKHDGRSMYALSIVIEIEVMLKQDWLVQSTYALSILMQELDN